MPTAERRQTDQVLTLLSERIQGVEHNVENTGKSLATHVAECAAIQKKVLGIVIFLAGWTVAHSPEAGKVLVKVFGVLG